MMQLTSSMELSATKRSWWSTLLWALLFMLLGPLISSIPAMILIVLLNPGITTETLMNDPINTFIMSMAGFPVVLILILICNHLFYRNTFASLGFFKQHWLLKYTYGGLLGLALMTFVFLINFATGAVSSIVNPEIKLVPILFITLSFIIQGMTEEVVCRGFIMNKISRQKGVVAGIVINSLFFAALHALNPGISVWAVVNIFLAGIVFSLLFYWSNNMWLTGAAHSLWNIALGVVYGSEVSGERLNYTIFNTHPNPSMSWLNGGVFGLEGGLATTVVSVLIIIAFVMMIMKHHITRK